DVAGRVVDVPVGDQVAFQDIALAVVVDDAGGGVELEEGGVAPHARLPGRHRLDHQVGPDPRVVDLAHVVPVDQVDLARLARLHHQVAVGGTTHVVRQQHRPAGPEVRVLAVQGGPVIGSKVIGDRQLAAGGEFDD